MKFTVLTLFPELFELYLSQTIIQRAVDAEIIDYNIVNIRDYSGNKHSQMDDIPFGGGAGMVLKPEAYWNFFKEKYSDREKPYTVFVSPQGKRLDHQKVTELAEKKEIVLISGRYEGLDQRVIDKFVDEEISIGDYVLSSGDLPSLVLMDSVTRIKEGVIKKESFETDSLEGYEVPEVLRSGNHAKIDEYRLLKSIEKTTENRPDLMEKKLSEDEEFKKMYIKLMKKKNK